MAKPPRLKVFRTAIGFHDAYVAAPSRAAALRAWGSGKDLFARGVAEEVTDPALAAEALARSGEVVKRLRGSAAEQLAALPPTPAKRKPVAPAPAPPDPPPVRERRRPPEPPRDALDAAEAALATAAARSKRSLAELEERRAALERETRAAERAARDEARRLERARDREKSAYDHAVAEWQGSD